MNLLRFKRWETPNGVSLSALLPVGASSCGIYVLEFENGEEYVGQTVSFLSRFSSHRRHFEDEIVAVRFATVPAERLNEAEQDVVASQVSMGVQLRNIDLITLPLRSDALDLVIDPAIQEQWLQGEVDPMVIGDRGRIAEQRLRTQRQYQTLASHPQHRAIVEAVAAYCRACLPWPHQTEGRFWVLSSMPSTGASSDWRRLATLTINNVEVLVLGETEEDRESGGTSGFLNIAGDAFLPRWLRGSIEKAAYRSVGEVHRVNFTDFAQVAVLLKHEEVAHGARKLAMGLLRKGKGMTGRFHDYNLADDVFRSLAAVHVASPDAFETPNVNVSKPVKTSRQLQRPHQSGRRAKRIGRLRRR